MINSVEKIILGLETFYDVLTSVEKIGWVTDLELESSGQTPANYCFSRLQLETENLRFRFPEAKTDVLRSINLKIEQGEKIIPLFIYIVDKSSF